MLKPPYNAVSQTPSPPGTPLTPLKPATPQYNESHPLTAQNPNSHYPISPSSHDYYDRSTKESYPLPDNTYTPEEPVQYTGLLHRDLIDQNRKLKKRIRILRFVSRIIITALTVAIAAEEGKTLRNFIKTHNDIRRPPGSPAPRGPWALKTQLWSAILLFSTGIVTAVLGLVSVIAYAISTKASNSVSGMNTKFGIAIESIHVIVWIAVAAAYRVAKNGKDLWGWACSPTAEKIQPTFHDVVNFHKVCGRSGVNFKLSIANSILQAASLGIWILVYKRMMTLKGLKRAQTEPKL